MFSLIVAYDDGLYSPDLVGLNFYIYNDDYNIDIIIF